MDSRARQCVDKPTDTNTFLGKQPGIADGEVGLALDYVLYVPAQATSTPSVWRETVQALQWSLKPKVGFR